MAIYLSPLPLLYAQPLEAESTALAAPLGEMFPFFFQRDGVFSLPKAKMPTTGVFQHLLTFSTQIPTWPCLPKKIPLCAYPAKKGASISAWVAPPKVFEWLKCESFGC